MNEIIKSMINQIGVGKMSAMVGAKNWNYSNDQLYVSFRFKMCKKANYFKIEYNEGMDTYTIYFKKIGNAPNYKINFVECFEDVYVDQIHSIFEKVTGLYTSL